MTRLQKAAIALGAVLTLSCGALWFQQKRSPPPASSQPEITHPAVSEIRPEHGASDLAASLMELTGSRDEIDRLELRKLIEKIDSENARAVAEAVLAERPEGEAPFGSIITAWARQDPQAALDYVIAREPGGKPPASIVGTVFREWGDRDAASAIRAADALAGDSLRRAARTAARYYLAKKNPEEALAMIAKDAGNAEYFSIDEIFSSLGASRGQQFAADSIASLPQGDTRETAAKVISRNWSKVNPAAAMAWAESIPWRRERAGACEAIIREWHRADFPAVLDWLNKQPSGDPRNALVRNLAFRVTPDQAMELLDLNTSVNDQNLMLQAIGRKLALENPASADSWAALQPDAGVREYIYLGIVRATAENRPLEAAEIALRTLKGKNLHIGMIDATRKWRESDPAAAFAWLSTNLPTNDLLEISDTVALSWYTRNPAGGAKWVETLPVGNERKDISKMMANHWAREDPAAAAAWAASQIEEVRPSALRGAGYTWGINDPVAAAAWAGHAPAGNPRAAFICGLMENWLRNDPSAAAQWFETKGAALGGDDVIPLASDILADFEPRRALQWAALIQEEERRHERMRRLAHKWLQNDAAQARAWIATSSLPQEAKQDLLRDDSRHD